MFSTEIRVNSQLIGHISGNRLYPYDEESFLYSYRYYDAEEGKLYEGYINHRYNDGLRKIIKLILADIDKQKTKGE